MIESNRKFLNDIEQTVWEWLNRNAVSSVEAEDFPPVLDRLMLLEHVARVRWQREASGKVYATTRRGRR